MLDLKRIGVFTRDVSQDYRLDALSRLFKRAHIELVVDAATAAPESLDLVIALGGDGTVLRALAAMPGVPVLAVNFGTVGFLTQCDRTQMDNVLVRLLSDDYQIEERLTLEISHAGQSYRCLNEVVIKGMTHMVTVGIDVNGRRVHSPRGDGVIVGTPTGSTAYLMSAGAPLVTPDVDCIIIKALNEYSFSSRSIIVPGQAAVELALEQSRDTDVSVIIDGMTRLPISNGQRVQIARSPVPARLVYFESDYFFRNLKERLRW